MNRSLLALLVLSAFALACTAKEEPTVIPPVVPPEIPPVTVKGRSCDISSWSPYTLEADVATRVVIKARCEGGELSRQTATEELSLTLPDGKALKVSAAVTLLQGDESEFAFTLPATPFQVGQLSLSLGGASGAYTVGTTPAPATFRLRKRYPSWEDFVDAPVSVTKGGPYDDHGWHADNPMHRTVSDLNGDGVLDVLVVERDGAKLRVGTLLGPSLALTKETVLSDVALDVKDPAESIRFGRPKGGTDNRKGALYWTAFDAALGEVRIAVIPVTDGLASSAKTFRTKDFAIGRISHMVQDSFAYRTAGTSGTTDELAVLYTGETGGKSHFGLIVTDTANGKLIPVATLDSLGGFTPADVASGAVKVGLLRDAKEPQNPRDACDLNALHAWTLGKTAATGEVEIRRVALSGAGAGTVQSSAKVTGYDPAEEAVRVDSLDMDGDGLGDVVLTSLAAGDAPVIRHWLSADGIKFTGTQRDLSTTGGLPLTAPGWRGPGTRLYTSVQVPYLLKSAPKPPKHGVGAQFRVRIDGGASALPVETTWDATAGSALKILSQSPLTPGLRAELTGLKSDAAVISSLSSSGALNIHVRSPDDELVLASHPSGLTLSFKGIGGGSIVVTDSATVRTVGSILTVGDGSFRLTSSPLVFQNASAADEHLVVLRDEQPGKDAQWLVYLSSKEGLSGPATLTIPVKFGRFLPLGASGDSFQLASVDSGRFSSLDWTFSAVGSATKLKGKLAPIDADLKAHFGVSSVSISVRSRPIGPPRLSMLCGKKGRRLAAPVAFTVDPGAAVAEGTRTTVALVGNDKKTGCPLSTVYFPGDPAKTTPVVLSTSDDESCDGLWQPVTTADLLGEGTTQVVLAKPQDFGGGLTQWTFAALTHDSTGVRATVLGVLPVATGFTPTVSAADLDGDSLADLVVAGASSPSHVFFSDGLGGSRDGAVKAGALSNIVRELPGAAPGGQGIQVACGQGLLCGNGSGTKNASSQSSTRPELL